MVGYHGTFWVDPSSMDLIRLEVYADDIPRNLEIEALWMRSSITD